MSPIVTVLVGPARCGKTHALVEKYHDVLTAEPAAAGRGLWLSPTARAAAEIREALVCRGASPRALVDPGVATFDALADRLLADAAASPRRLTPFLERRLLGRVIDRARDERRLQFLAEAAGRASFVDLVADHFHELQRHGVAPPAFARSIGSRGNRAQHEELAGLYADYIQQLERHRLVDAEGMHAAASRELAANSHLFANLQLVVADGFTDFTHPQLDILAALAARCGQLYISLPAAPPLPLAESRGEGGRSELFAKSAATLAELRHRFAKLVVEPMPDRGTGWPALDQIARHVFQHPRDIPPPPPAAVASLDRLEIVAAAGEQDEVLELARRIKQRLVDERQQTGTARPGNIVVVFRNLRAAAARVREVFDEFGIPYSLEAGLPLAATGIVRALLDLLRLEAERWPFRRVVAVVTNNLFTAFDRHGRAAADWLIRELQIPAGRDRLLDRVETLAGELASASGKLADHHLRQAQAASLAAPHVRELAAVLDELPSTASPAAWIAALEHLSQRLGIDAIVSMDDNDNRAAWQSIVGHLRSLERCAAWLDESPPELSRAALIELLVDLARHESLPRPADDTGRVRVLSAATARTVEAKHIFLAGMSEQAYPAPERAGQLYSAADYRFFAAAADQSRAAAELPSADRSQEEMLLFYEVLTRATERLTISYPGLDEKAQSLEPSPYVTEIERAIAPAEVPHRRAARPSPLPMGAAPLGPADWRIQAVHAALSGDLRLLAGLFQAGATGTASAARAANSLEAALRITASRSRRDAFGPGEGLLESDAVRARLARRFGSEHLWSPSQWERYALCPYKFFLSDVLGREPLGELVLETDHRRRGTLVHRALAEFHRRLPELLGEHTQLSAHDVSQFVREFENVVEALVRAMSRTGIDAALVELDRRQIVKWGVRYHAEHAAYDAAWEDLETLAPAYLEWRFGPPRSDEAEGEDPRSTSEPFTLEIAGENIHVTGRIDRIDLGQYAGNRVFNVIDYKSGPRPSLTPEKIASGERLQPALYVMAAQALLFEGDDATPLWAGYWSMVDGVALSAKSSLRCSQDYRTPSEDWEHVRASVVEQIGRFVRDIRHGNFPVASRDDQCTSRCEFATVCRVAQVRSLGKQWFPAEDDSQP